MVLTLAAAAGLLLGWTGDSGASELAKPPARAEYEAKNAEVGRDSRAHVRLALWCEQNGLSAERAKHLALAVLIDPKNTLARGLSGLVAYQGAWKRPETISAKVKADADLGARLAEYNARREGVGNSADAQWKLALWCEEQGLDAEARAHFTSVVRLDPRRDAAWSKLGLKKVGHRWVSDDQLAAEKADFEAQKAADKHWRPLLLKWHAALASKIKAKRAEAEAALEQISDPRSVPALWDSFAKGDEKSQARAVEILARIDGVEASRALATLAVYSRSGEVRRAAVETLRQRDVREVVGWLIGLIQKPVRFEVRRPNGLGSPGQLFVEGEKFDTLRDYTPRGNVFVRGPLAGGADGVFDAAGNPVFGVSRALVDFGPGLSANVLNTLQNMQTSGPITHPAPGHGTAAASGHPRAGVSAPGPSGLVDFGPVVVRQSPEQLAATAARVSEQNLESDVQSIESNNSTINNANGLVLNALTPLTGKDLPPDASAWMSWWANEQGYAFQASTQTDKPTILETVGPGTTQTFHHSCFRAGTPVRTLTGPRAIDSIEVGDRVLVQETTSGEMRFEPVLAVYHNKPATLHKVDLGSESIWATGIHRFWKAGRGWVMARDLKPGDAVRTLGGTLTVQSVEEGPVEPVFNLEVGGGQSFFVGNLGALVHDNSLVRPVEAPFDAVSVADASLKGK
jgi:Pretoxin HINT domain